MGFVWVFELWGCSVSDPALGAPDPAPAIVAEPNEGRFLKICLSGGRGSRVPSRPSSRPTSARRAADAAGGTEGRHPRRAARTRGRAPTPAGSGCVPSAVRRGDVGLELGREGREAMPAPAGSLQREIKPSK